MSSSFSRGLTVIVHLQDRSSHNINIVSNFSIFVLQGPFAQPPERFHSCKSFQTFQTSRIVSVLHERIVEFLASFPHQQTAEFPYHHFTMSNSSVTLVVIQYARLLNDNQLTGEVPSSLGAFPIRGGVLK